MSSEFWARKIGGIAQPAPQAPAPQQGGAWWQEPVVPQPQAPQQYQNPALQAQMPYSGPTGGAGLPEEQYVRQLLRVPADELTQEQMETIARWELANKGKYNTECPQCGSTSYVPAGTKLGGTTFSTEKCFECGLSARGPEPALGGGRPGNSSAAYKEVRQIDTGGASGSMYMKFNGVPAGYVPRGG